MINFLKKLIRFKNPFLLLLLIGIVSLPVEGSAEDVMDPAITQRYQDTLQSLGRMPGAVYEAVVAVLNAKVEKPFFTDMAEANAAIKSGIIELEELIKEGYEPEGIYYVLGTTYHRVVDYENAIRYYNLSIEKDDPREQVFIQLFALLLDLKRYEDYESRLEIYKEKFPDRLAPTYLFKGMMLQRKGEPRNAIPEFEKALEIDPQLVEARIALGTIYLILGESEAAAEQFNLVREQKPRLKEFVDRLESQLGAGAQTTDASN